MRLSRKPSKNFEKICETAPYESKGAERVVLNALPTKRRAV
jgi:hypothetical protein